ncbi:unnamed protein product [Sphagnum troendelagicum]|uniref:Secreted protein n=1 Tax=Sphagnum troendelagicum TaxID=128251 RepID=A0ABP0TVV1_9BRYO
MLPRVVVLGSHVVALLVEAAGVLVATLSIRGSVAAYDDDDDVVAGSGGSLDHDGSLDGGGGSRRGGAAGVPLQTFYH